MHSRSVIFVVISALLVGAIYSSSTFAVFALLFKTPVKCTFSKDGKAANCCWDEGDGKTIESYCSLCGKGKDGKWSCYPPVKQSRQAIIPPGLDEALVSAQGGGITGGNNHTKVPIDRDVPTDGGLLKDNSTTGSNNNTKIPKGLRGLNDSDITINPGLR